MMKKRYVILDLVMTLNTTSKAQFMKKQLDFIKI